MAKKNRRVDFKGKILILKEKWENFLDDFESVTISTRYTV